MSWISKATDCASFEKGLRGFYTAVGQSERLTPETKLELKQVLYEACDGRFKACNFDLCGPKVETSKSPVSTVTTTTTPAVQAARPPSKRFASPESRVAKPVTKLFPANDPISWLNQPLDCPGLQEQLKIRYGPLLPYERMNPDKQRELDRVLNIACSDRFAHCNFSNCPGIYATAKERSAPAVRDIENMQQRAEAEIRQEQEERYEQLIVEKDEARIQRVTQRIAAEKKAGATWLPFRVPTETPAKRTRDAEDDDRSLSAPKTRTPPGTQSSPPKFPRSAIPPRR